MSDIEEQEIRRRLECISNMEPSREAAAKAVERTRRRLLETRAGRRGTASGVIRMPGRGHIARFAAAAVVMIGLGYAAGRISAPTAADIESIRAELKESLTSEIVGAIDSRWDAAIDSKCTQLKDELQQQVRQDLAEFASQTLAASGTMTDRRLLELVRLIDDARVQDRLRVKEALRQIEFNRRQDNTAIANGLKSLVVTAEWPPAAQRRDSEK